MVIAELKGLLSLLCPRRYVDSVLSLDIAELKQQGFCALLLDLDNTLVPWRSYDIAPEVAAWVKRVESQGLKLCIVSNTCTQKRLRTLADVLGVPFVRGSKPRRKGFREGLKLLEVESDRAAVIGDQIFTDILGGNRLGVYTILVSPLGHVEFIGTKVSRLLERIVLGLLKKRGMLCLQSTKSPMSGEQSTDADRQMKTE